MIEWLKQQLKTHDGFQLSLYVVGDAPPRACTLLAVDHIGLVVQRGERIDMVPWAAVVRVAFIE